MLQGQYHRNRLYLDLVGVGKCRLRQRIAKAREGRTGGGDGVDLAKRTIIIVITGCQAGPVRGGCVDGEGWLRLENEDGITLAIHVHVQVRDDPDRRKAEIRQQEQQTPDCGKLSAHDSNIPQQSRALNLHRLMRWQLEKVERG